MRSPAWAVSAIALAVLVAGAGCGGDDEEITTGDVSKQEFIAQADQICAEGDREIERAGREYFGPGGGAGLEEGDEPTEDQFVTFIEETVVPNIQGQLDDLRELEVPEADADQIEELYDTAQDNLDELADDPGAFAGGDSNPFQEANRIARDYGLEDCGS